MVKRFAITVAHLLIAITCGAVHASEAPTKETILESTEALSILNLYIKDSCNDPAAYELRGDAYKSLGRNDLAAADYQTAALLKVREASYNPGPR